MRREGEFVVSDNDVDDLLFEGLGQDLSWNGRPIWKNPVDLIVYHEIAWGIRPSVVIETGTSLGGGTEFWREQPGVQLVVTVDVYQRCSWPKGSGVIALEGSSTDPEIVSEIKRLIAPVAGYAEPVLVNLDSDHSRDHVLAELDAYAPLVTRGSYLIVEDGIDDLSRGFTGPLAATREWLPAHPEFAIDKHMQRAGITNCPDGFLERVS